MPKTFFSAVDHWADLVITLISNLINVITVGEKRKREWEMEKEKETGKIERK